MGLFDAFQLPPEPCTAPIPWLEREIGHFYAPQKIQCRVCRQYKTADSRLFRAAKTSDVLRTTCRKCELETRYGRTLNKRAQLIQQDPTLPTPFKQHLLRALPDEVRMSKVERLKAYSTAERTHTFRKEWRVVSQMITTRRRILLKLLASNRRLGSEGGPGGRLHQLRTESPLCAHYISELLHMYTHVIRRIRSTQVWGKLINWHLPPVHWRASAEHMVDYPPGSSHYHYLCESLSPWEFTTRAERAQLDQLSPMGLPEYDPTRQRWLEIISRGQGSLMRRMYPEMSSISVSLS